jgi:mannose/cellobiose epimerase-like protein (N-acyl-D-glucosamine 2-epimerase family)
LPLTFTGFREEVKEELFNILDYWIRYSVDQQNGGFYAEATAENVPVIRMRQEVW